MYLSLYKIIVHHNFLLSSPPKKTKLFLWRSDTHPFLQPSLVCPDARRFSKCRNELCTVLAQDWGNSPVPPPSLSRRRDLKRQASLAPRRSCGRERLCMQFFIFRNMYVCNYMCMAFCSWGHARAVDRLLALCIQMRQIR